MAIKFMSKEIEDCVSQLCDLILDRESFLRGYEDDDDIYDLKLFV